MRLNMTSRILESVQESNEDTKTLSYKVFKEEASLKEEKVCPRCGNNIIGYPAISRYDNETEICSDCGTDEAFENMAGYMTNPNTGERVSLDDLKAQRRAENEDRAGELRAAMDDGALADDEIEAVNSEISELEDSLNEGAYLDNRDMLVKYFNEAWSEAKFLQAEMRFAKPSISKLRESIPVICDNLDKLGELLKVVDNSESASVDESISEDTLKESVDWTSNPIWTKVVNTLDSSIYDMEKEEAIALLEQIKKDCDVFINNLK